MYKRNYGQRQQYGGDQANKALYDVRDNLDAQTRRIAGLAKTIKQLYEYVVIIEDVLQERGCISGSELKRKHSLSRASNCKKQISVLQKSTSCDETEGVCSSKRQSGYGMVHIHDKGQTPHAEVVRKRPSFDVSPPRGHNDDKTNSDKE